MTAKQCSKCGEVKPATLHYFYKKTINSFGDLLLMGRCKPCCKPSKEKDREYCKTYYQKNKETICEKKKKKRAELREKKEKERKTSDTSGERKGIKGTVYEVIDNEK